MEELLQLEKYSPKSAKKGEVIEGTVISVSPVEVLVDIGGKSEGIISNREIPEGEEVQPGDKVLAYVVQSEDEAGQTILSLRRAGGEKRWRELGDLNEAETPLQVHGLETNRGGLVVDVGGGVRGFVPSSQLDQTYAGNKGIGKSFEAKIIELDRKSNRLILSQKSLTAEANRKKFEGATERFKAGQVVTGKVSGVMPYGLFVSLEEGLEGLVHISEVSWERVNNLAELYKIGDEIEVKVLSIDPAAGRINLSVKALQEDPWKAKITSLKPGTKVKGEVTKVNQFGVFVQLEQGIEGLIHTSKIPEYMVDIKPGLQLDLTVEQVNPDNRRLSLVVDEGDINELKPIAEIVEDSFEEDSVKAKS